MAILHIIRTTPCSHIRRPHRIQIPHTLPPTPLIRLLLIVNRALGIHAKELPSTRLHGQVTPQGHRPSKVLPRLMYILNSPVPRRPPDCAVDINAQHNRIAQVPSTKNAFPERSRTLWYGGPWRISQRSTQSSRRITCGPPP